MQVDLFNLVRTMTAVEIAKRFGPGEGGMTAPPGGAQSWTQGAPAPGTPPGTSTTAFARSAAVRGEGTAVLPPSTTSHAAPVANGPGPAAGAAAQVFSAGPAAATAPLPSGAVAPMPQSGYGTDTRQGLASSFRPTLAGLTPPAVLAATPSGATVAAGGAPMSLDVSPAPATAKNSEGAGRSGLPSGASSPVVPQQAVLGGPSAPTAAAASLTAEVPGAAQRTVQTPEGTIKSTVPATNAPTGGAPMSTTGQPEATQRTPQALGQISNATGTGATATFQAAGFSALSPAGQPPGAIPVARDGAAVLPGSLTNSGASQSQPTTPAPFGIALSATPTEARAPGSPAVLGAAKTVAPDTGRAAVAEGAAISVPDAAPAARAGTASPVASATVIAEALLALSAEKGAGGQAAGTMASMVILNAAMIPGWPFRSALVEGDAPEKLKAMAQELARLEAGMSPKEMAEYLAKMGARLSLLVRIRKSIETLGEDALDAEGFLAVIGKALAAVMEGLKASMSLMADQEELARLMAGAEVSGGDRHPGRQRLRL